MASFKTTLERIFKRSYLYQADSHDRRSKGLSARFFPGGILKEKCPGGDPPDRSISLLPIFRYRQPGQDPRARDQVTAFFVLESHLLKAR